MKKIILTVLTVIMCATLFCACGNSLDEKRPSGEHAHKFVNYVYNDDATCVKGGTETAKCKYCDETDTRPSADHPATGVHGYVDYVCKTCGAIDPAAPNTEGLEFREIRDEGENVIGYSVSAGTARENTYIKIPSEHNGKPVTAIGYQGFYYGIDIKSVAIPDGVTSIWDMAFAECTDLVKVTIPDSVTSIGSQAFARCGKLASIAIPDSVIDIRYGSFSGCSSLTDITVQSGNTKYHSSGNCLIETETKTLVVGCMNSVIPDDGSVTSIGGRSFERCLGLTTIDIPSTVTSISSLAFYRCERLSSVAIPNSVTEIGGQAFAGCYGLTNLAIPVEVTTIGGGAFDSCVKLVLFCEAAEKPDGFGSVAQLMQGIPWTSCPVVWDCNNNNADEDGNEYVVIDGVRYSINDGAAGVSAVPIDVSGEAVVPSSITYKDKNYAVTKIDQAAFAECRGMTAIAVPESITKIEGDAFVYCEGLTAVNYAGSFAEWCEIEFGDKDSNPVYHAHALFIDGKAVTELALPATVKEIKNCTFAGLSALTKAVIPEGVTAIGTSAFEGCDGLTSVLIPSSVTTIGGSSFEHCTALTAIEIPIAVTNMGYGVFDGCDGLTVYCEAAAAPKGWDSYWNGDCTVVWDHKK